MSKLQELKNKLCSNGIEYKKLRETCIIKSGEFASPKELSKIQDDLHIYPCYGSNGLRGYINKFNYDGEYPIVGRVGACGSVNYINGKYFITDNAFIVKSKKNEYIPKFLYYLLKSLNLNKYKLGGAQPAINGKMIYDLSAPIPPLEVQAEIVRILDTFTELIKELIKEHELRKKQYSYYRDKLLTFENNSLKKRFRDTCIIKSGEFASPKELSKIQDDLHIYPCYGSNGLRGYINKFNYDGEYPIVGRVGALCGSVNYVSGKFFVTDNALIVQSKGEYIPRFLYYLLISLNLNKYKAGGAQPAIAGKTIYDLSAPLPTLDTQKRIVDILDNFEKYTNDLQEGLPAEIEKRKKQYEFYRDKLLTFEKI